MDGQTGGGGEAMVEVDGGTVVVMAMGEPGRVVDEAAVVSLAVEASVLYR